MVRPADIEIARLRMVQARKALEDYEKLNGHSTSLEHEKLTKIFTRATEIYLRASEDTDTLSSA